MSLMPETASAGDMGRSFFLIGLINRFNNSFQAVVDATFVEISWKQVFFLNCITMFEQPPSIREMADLIGCSHQNAKQILSKLEKLGFVVLRQDPCDKRKQRIVLTKHAQEFRHQFDGPSVEAMQTLFCGVGEAELETTIQVMTKLIAAVDAMREEQK
jgi:DNA-binding MarR family transcriptional regulator